MALIRRLPARFRADEEALPVDDKFAPDTLTFGVHGNLAFESLTATPNNRYLYAATESVAATGRLAGDTHRGQSGSSH